MQTGVDPFGSVPKLERIGLECTQNLLYPIQFGSAIVGFIMGAPDDSSKRELEKYHSDID